MLFGLPKFGSLRGSTSASLKIGEILAICIKLASFWNWGSHLFCATCWHIYYLFKQQEITPNVKFESIITSQKPENGFIPLTTYCHFLKVQLVLVKLS